MAFNWYTQYYDYVIGIQIRGRIGHSWIYQVNKYKSTRYPYSTKFGQAKYGYYIQRDPFSPMQWVYQNLVRKANLFWKSLTPPEKEFYENNIPYNKIMSGYNYCISDYIYSHKTEEVANMSFVISFKSRTGLVVPVTDDYTWAQINKSVSSIADLTTKTHALLASLNADDHPQYLLADGTRALSGNLRTGGNYISNDGDNEGITVNVAGNVDLSGSLNLIPGMPIYLANIRNTFIKEISANIIGLYTDNNLALQIDGSGRITKPLNPCCKVYLSATLPNVTNSAWTICPFNAETYDIGSNYSTVTYKFTAPVAGKYLVNASLVFGQAQNNKWYGIDLYQNTTEVCYTIIGYLTHAVDQLQVTLNTVVSCAAGDTLCLRYYNQEAVSTADIYGGDSCGSFMTITLLN